MKRLIFFGLLLLFPCGLIAQRFLVLENQSSLKNFKYYEGQRLQFKSVGHEKRVSDYILSLNDSSVLFENIGDVMISDITVIYRENWLIRTLSAMSFIGAGAYFGLDSFNRLINNDAPVVLAETAMISGGLAVFGVALLPFYYRKIGIGDKWKLRTLDPMAF